VARKGIEQADDPHIVGAHDMVDDTTTQHDADGGDADESGKHEDPGAYARAQIVRLAAGGAVDSP
jgi:hypothetical protein